MNGSRRVAEPRRRFLKSVGLGATSLIMTGPDLVEGRDGKVGRAKHASIQRPALTYTRGINAGGYSQNRNRLETEVRLQLP